MSNPTREMVGTVVDANGVACTVYRDMALTEVTLEAADAKGTVGITLTCSPFLVRELSRMLMGKRPSGLRAL